MIAGRMQASISSKQRKGARVAVLAVDYLNDECTAEVLLGVPLKVSIETKLER